jgi:hypothetical protein
LYLIRVSVSSLVVTGKVKSPGNGKEKSPTEKASEYNRKDCAKEAERDGGVRNVLENTRAQSNGILTAAMRAGAGCR